MNWAKLGLVFNASGEQAWAMSHAMIPTPMQLDHERVRVFITCCDTDGIGRIGYVDVCAHDPTQVVKGLPEKPLVDVGKPGTFDENGALVCSALRRPDDSICLYYAGFELGRRIRYRLLSGAASGLLDDEVFTRYSEVPVLERSDQELYFRGGPFCIYDRGVYRMWYVAGAGWEEVMGVDKPVYEIRYVESADGWNWPKQGATCIPIEADNEHGFGRPWVVTRGSNLEMYYSVRRRDLGSYRLGFARSEDGRNWKRDDSAINLDVSQEGWDSEMICYSAVIDLHGTTYMFYNGNNFGASGFGVARLEG